EHLQQAERQAADKPGMSWVRNAFLQISRRHEELRQRILAEAASLAGAGDRRGRPGELFLANYLFSQATSCMEGNEVLRLLDLLQPVYQRQPAHVQSRKQWLQWRVNYLQQVGRSDDALREYKQLATAYPRDANVQQAYVHHLAGAGEWDAAYVWLT